MALLQQWQNMSSRWSEKVGSRLNAPVVGKIARYLPRVLLILGIILLAWQLAAVTWYLFGADGRDDELFVAPTKQTASAKDQPKQAVAYDLFEEEQKIPQKADKPVRKNLNLMLHGIIARSDPKQGSALISPKNAVPQVYRVGEQVSPGVTLDEIYPNYVLLLRGDTYEQLALPKSHTGLSSTKRKQTKSNAALDGEPVVVNAPRVTRKLARYRKQLKQNPMALARLLRGKPVMRNGKIHGVQISRGNDPTLISDIGLQDKDVLLSLNGISLNDIKQLPTLIKTLSEDDRFEVMLERNGVTQSINIYLEM